MGGTNSTNGTFDPYHGMDPEQFKEMLFIYMTMYIFESIEPSGETYRYILPIFSVALILPVSAFGLVTNIINVIVFYRQGIMADSCTPSLVALALSDFCVNCINFADGFINALYAANNNKPGPTALNDYYIISEVVTQPYPMFTLVTCAITAYLAFERMVGVTFPFRVKDFFTARLSIIINLIIFAVLFVLSFPRMSQHGFKRFQGKLLDVSFIPVPLHLKVLSDEILLALRMVTLLLILVFNIVISVRVFLSDQFRKGKGSGISNKKTSFKNTNQNIETKLQQAKTKNVNKELKLIRMMSVLCLLLLVSYIPPIVIKLLGKKILILDAIGQFLETINSSGNIIIFYTMSSKYKKELNGMVVSCRNIKKL